MLYDNSEFEHDSHNFRVTFPHDDCAGAPWENEDGHGPVSAWERRGKAPGEMILCEDRGSRRFYNFVAAVKQARKEGWDTPPYGEGTKGERAHRAALADFDRLRRFCSGQWSYVGCVVTLLDDEGDEMDNSASLWGIESDCSEYLEQVARELAGEVLSDLQASLAA
jgi:hypothetical protein